MTVREKVLETVAEVLNQKDIGKLFESQDGLEVLNLNSISFISLVVELEKAFDFEFDDEALTADRFPTLIALCEYIQSK